MRILDLDECNFTDPHAPPAFRLPQAQLDLFGEEMGAEMRMVQARVFGKREFFYRCVRCGYAVHLGHLQRTKTAALHDCATYQRETEAA